LSYVTKGLFIWGVIRQILIITHVYKQWSMCGKLF